MVSIPSQEQITQYLNKLILIISGSNESVQSYGSVRQETSDAEEVFYVNQELYRKERNAFCLAKMALEMEEGKEKEEEEDLWALPPPRNPKN